MSKLTLVYGLRLLPADEVVSTGDALLVLKDGRSASVTMHVIDGVNEEEIRKQLMLSLDAFFDFYPEL